MRPGAHAGRGAGRADHRVPARAGRSRGARAAASVAAAVVLSGCLWGVAALFAAALDEPLPPCTDASTSVCSGPPVDHTERGTVKDSLPPCPTEDSTGCVWDASEQGNGQGHDVVNPPAELP